MFHVPCSMDINHIAKLARIVLSKEEAEKINKDISAILDYVEKLKQVETGDIEPMSHAAGQINITRKDKAEESSRESAEKLLAQAPEKNGRYVKTRAIF